MNKVQDNAPVNFELTLANGKTRAFKSGYDMWQWAVQNNQKMEFADDNKPVLSLSDWFNKRGKKV
jgi:hypothetical protein